MVCLELADSCVSHSYRKEGAHIICVANWRIGLQPADICHDSLH